MLGLSKAYYHLKQFQQIKQKVIPIINRESRMIRRLRYTAERRCIVVAFLQFVVQFFPSSLYCCGSTPSRIYESFHHLLHASDE